MRTNIVLDDRLVAEAMRGKPLIDPRYDVREVRRTMRRDAR